MNVSWSGLKKRCRHTRYSICCDRRIVVNPVFISLLSLPFISLRFEFKFVKVGHCPSSSDVKASKLKNNWISNQMITKQMVPLQTCRRWGEIKNKIITPIEGRKLVSRVTQTKLCDDVTPQLLPEANFSAKFLFSRWEKPLPVVNSRFSDKVHSSRRAMNV